MDSGPDDESNRPTGPWGATGPVGEGREPAIAPARGDEPIFKAPIMAVLAAGSILALYFLQARTGRSIEVILTYGLRPADLFAGQVSGLFTHMLVHDGWMHASMNAIGALAFGAAAARRLPGVRGAIGFLALYIVCGVLAGAGYSLLHADSTAPLVGASGAVFGLIGAATRLMSPGGRLLPLTDRRVITTSLVWMAVNAALGLLGVTPGAEGASVAWEAHIIGLIAGLLLVGPVLRLFGGPSAGFDSRAGLGDPRR